MARTPVRAKVEAQTETKVKNADEMAALATVAAAQVDKAALTKQHTDGGKPVKELDDIEAGIVGWLTDNGWFMQMESDLASRRSRFQVESNVPNFHAQASIAARQLRAMGFQVLVEPNQDNTVVTVSW